MDTHIGCRMRADPDTIFRLAAAVEDWPRILPHYRWVRVVERAGPHHLTVEMAARRPVIGRLAIPLWWTAVEIADPTSRRIEFEHVRGITRGMRVAWTIDQDRAAGVLVQIRHVFAPHWPVPDWLVHQIVGEFFVNSVARKTLHHITQMAEASGKWPKDA